MTRWSRNAPRFRAYIWLAWYGTVLARLNAADDGDAVLDDASRPACVSSQLPPRSAARSTITEPGAMLATISRVTSTGDFLPGITAAVIDHVALGHDPPQQLALAAIEGLVLGPCVAPGVLGVLGLDRAARRNARRGSGPAPWRPAAGRTPRRRRRAAAPWRSPGGRPRRPRSPAPAPA